ncbi:MAG: sulfatase-like hydrolase/transferase [Phycisphaerae bacterium]|nr:sulfatase-like hydrolase/transferase [Phycisphaerae bacterium]
MNRRDFMAQLAFAGMGITFGGCGLPDKTVSFFNRSEDNPNILIIVTDDQGYADLSAYAHAADDVNTPNMDRIAKEGTLMSRAYVSCPVCSPSRAGWNTGLYQQRWNPQAGWNPGLPVDVKTIAEYMKEAGYETCKIGKNDYGKNYHRTDVREHPLNHGYDEFLGFSSHAHDFFLLSEEIEKRTPDPHGHSAALGQLYHNNDKQSFEDGYTTEIFTDFAIDYVKQRKDQDKPFFMTLSYNAVHHLIHEVPKKYLDRFGVKEIPNYDPGKDNKNRYNAYYTKYSKVESINSEDMRKYYLANLNCLDDNIGRLLDVLDQQNLTEETLVIFFADNGGSPLTGACNQPLRGSKYIMFEGGIRVPFMIRWPGRIPAGEVYDHRLSTLDILPSCIKASGRDIPDDAVLDGYDFLEAVSKGTESSTAGKPAFWQFKDHWAVIDGDWKLVKTTDYTSRKPTHLIRQGPKPDANRPALFNLKDDIAEQNDLYSKNPEIVTRLTGLYQNWRKQCSQNS